MFLVPALDYRYMGGGSSPPAVSPALLLETGDVILLETDDELLLEDAN